MKRLSTRPRRDRKIFRRTAMKSKAVNVYPYSMRGGIRL